MKRKLYYRLLLLTAIFLNFNLQAQVRIGGGANPTDGAILDLNSTTKGGLLFSRVDIPDLDLIPYATGVFPGVDASTADTNESLWGMVVYNTNSTTGEGLYIWDGERWKSVAVGSGITIHPSLVAPIDRDGGETEEITVANPNCSMGGDFTYIVLAGGDYASVSPENSVDGKFTVTFQPNNIGLVRSAVILVTDPCGNSATFIFTQEAAECPAPASATPAVATYNGALSFCSGGYVHAYVSNAVAGANYYWLLNGALVAEGNGVELKQAGHYTVYADMIGCGVAATLDITGPEGGVAPAALQVIVDNGGMICGSTGVTLSVLNAPGTGEIQWFHDGTPVSGATGNQYTIPGAADGAGIWYAVYNDGSCISAPSNKIPVFYNDADSSIADPVASVNETPMGGTLTICASGTLELKVDNATDYTNPVFEWFANGNSLGATSRNVMYVVPPNYSKLILSLKVTVDGSCPKSVTSPETTVNQGSTPATTAINDGASKAYICGTNPASLSANENNGASYEWFREGDLISSSGFSYNAASSGSYTVRCRVISGNLPVEGLKTSAFFDLLVYLFILCAV
jgi:hypothetical protein